MNQQSSNGFEGGCACRHLRYRMATEPLIVHCCHCRRCQRETGSSFALNALIESDRLMVLEGEPEFINTPSESGKGQRVARCPHCKVAVWSHYAGSGDAISFVRVGTLDDPDRFPPGVNIHTRSKQPWLTLDPGVPAFEDYYRLSEVWSEDAQQRRRELAARTSA